MTPAEAIVRALEEWIDAKIARERARDSSDGGLIESILIYDLRQEVVAAIERAAGGEG